LGEEGENTKMISKEEKIKTLHQVADDLRKKATAAGVAGPFFFGVWDPKGRLFILDSPAAWDSFSVPALSWGW
jgi:hypothetical protein